MNTTFQADRVIHLIDSMRANIAPEIPRHIERWGGQIVPYPEGWIRPIFNSLQEWDNNIDDMRYFAYERQNHAKEHIRNYFRLEMGMITLTIQSANPEAGILKLNNQFIENNFHTGEYFKNVPLTVRAMSHVGYRFSHWVYTEDGSMPEIVKNAEIVIDQNLSIELEAHFESDVDTEPYVIINEINYNSHEDFNTGDWIELYNNRNEPVDLSGWILKDDNDDHIFNFPDGLDIDPYGYLVICEDVTAFRELFPLVKDPIGGMSFGLGNDGDAIRMFAPDGSLRDVVYYEDLEPWPVPPDGDGPTLELIDPDFDNLMPYSWASSDRHGTPGQQNQINTIDENMLGQNYPNPMSNETIIPYMIFTPGFVSIKVFDSMGRIINTLINENQETAFYELYLDAGELNTGIYFYSLTVDNIRVDTKRMIIIK
jgi:hypothetical protein